MMEVARYLWEGERNRWEIGKGVVAKLSKNVIKLSEYLQRFRARKITSKFFRVSAVLILPAWPVLVLIYHTGTGRSVFWSVF
jgi:hypothetical protein